MKNNHTITMKYIRSLSLMFLLIMINPSWAFERLSICVDYHCEIRVEVEIKQHDWDIITQSFQQTARNAQQERRQISDSIAQYERLIGQYSQTSQDQAKNQGEDELGQLDCISESYNTQLYLEWLQRKKLLRWHTVSNRQLRSRGPFTQHWSAFIKERSSKKKFAIDSWHYKNGEPPIIQSEKDWFEKKSVNNQVVP